MKWQFVIVGVLVSGIAASAEIKFEKFTSKPFGFSVLMPGTPKEQTTKIKSGLGDLDNNSFTVITDNKVFWNVLVIDYPAGSAAERQEALLDGAVNVNVNRLKGKKISETKNPLDGTKFPGRQVQIEAESVGFVRAHMYLVGDRLYQVIVQGPKEVVTSADATKYLESFKLVN